MLVCGSVTCRKLYCKLETVLAFCGFLSFHVSFRELKGNRDHNGFFGRILRFQSGLEEQLMAIAVRIPVK